MPLTGKYAPSTSDFAREQAELFGAIYGVDGGVWQGARVVVLTTVGAKSGSSRKTVVMRVELDGTYAVVASRDGAPTHLVWYWNLKKNPRVELHNVASPSRDFLARELFGTERELWWERAVRAWPDYDQYRARTSRVLPVFLLEDAVAE